MMVKSIVRITVRMTESSKAYFDSWVYSQWPGGWFTQWIEVPQSGGTEGYHPYRVNRLLGQALCGLVDDEA